jgi:hypothetical protein
MLEGLFRRPPHEESIPVLTEILAPAAADPPVARTEVVEPGVLAQTRPDAPEAFPPAEQALPDLGRTQGLSVLTGSDLTQLEARIRDAVLTRLHPRIDRSLSERIDTAIHDVLAAEMPALHEKIGAALTLTLNDAVSRAISKELAKLHAEHMRNNESG